MDNFPCKCGHTKEDHEKDNGKGPAWIGVCQVPIKTNFGSAIRPFCYHEFYVADNLKYLEMKYEELIK